MEARGQSPISPAGLMRSNLGSERERRESEEEAGTKLSLPSLTSGGARHTRDRERRGARPGAGPPLTPSSQAANLRSEEMLSWRSCKNHQAVRVSTPPHSQETPLPGTDVWLKATSSTADLSLPSPGRDQERQPPPGRR